MIIFEKGLQLLNDKGYTTYRIRQEKILGQATLARMKAGTKDKENGVASTVIDKLCKLLDCQPCDLMEYVPDDD